MEQIKVKDIFAAVQAGKLRAFMDGPSVWIEDTQTHEAVCLVADTVLREPPKGHKSRAERMFGSRENWVTADADKGQGPYKGFLLVVCEECGKVKAFCAKHETYSFKCDCGCVTPLENMKPMFMHCKCGKSFRYKTNATTATITHACLDCKAPVDMELNKRGDTYVTIGVRKERK